MQGSKKCVIKKEITFKNYLDCLQGGKKQHRGMNTFRSRQHKIYTERVNKIAFSADDDKRIIMDDGVKTKASGHYQSE